MKSRPFFFYRPHTLSTPERVAERHAARVLAKQGFTRRASLKEILPKRRYSVGTTSIDKVAITIYLDLVYGNRLKDLNYLRPLVTYRCPNNFLYIGLHAEFFDPSGNYLDQIRSFFFALVQSGIVAPPNTKVLDYLAGKREALDPCFHITETEIAFDLYTCQIHIPEPVRMMIVEEDDMGLRTYYSRDYRPGNRWQVKPGRWDYVESQETEEKQPGYKNKRRSLIAIYPRKALLEKKRQHSPTDPALLAAERRLEYRLRSSFFPIIGHDSLDGDTADIIRGLQCYLAIRSTQYLEPGIQFTQVEVTHPLLYGILTHANRGKKRYRPPDRRSEPWRPAPDPSDDEDTL